MLVAVVDKGEERKFGSGRRGREEGKKERREGGMEEWKNGKRLDFVPLLLTTATTIYCC